MVFSRVFTVIDACSRSNTEMTSANQNRQKKTRGFRLVTKILKAPAESAGPADSKSALIILLTSPEVAYRGGVLLRPASSSTPSEWVPSRRFSSNPLLANQAANAISLYICFVPLSVRCVLRCAMRCARTFKMGTLGGGGLETQSSVYLSHPVFAGSDRHLYDPK